MFCWQSTVPSCLKFIPISLTGPKHAPKDTYLIFQPIYMRWACGCSSNLNYAHICIENSVNAKECPNEPQKITKIDTTLLLFYVDMRKNLKAIRGNRYCFVPKVGTFPTETIMLVVRSSGLWEAYTQTCLKWDNFFTMTCWCRSMIACQVSWISDEFWIY